MRSKKDQYKRLKDIINKCLDCLDKVNILEYLGRPEYEPDELDEFIVSVIIEREETDGRDCQE